MEQFEPHAPAGPLQPVAVAGAVDEDAAHARDRRGEEVSAAVEPLVADEPQARPVNERGGVERVAGSFRGRAGGSEGPQLVGHEWEQVGRSPAVTGRGGIEEACHIGHAFECNRRETAGNAKSPDPSSVASPDGYRSSTSPLVA